ncbi:MAG: T9SS type A sorting domain-containing protein [Imperialibacter sp.]|uniref:T9SS type A sorting domain-containing protein n=1 Tax=Imperialibacter sp. TaxID=2038411 RepID=UPI0032EF1785
MKNFKLSIFLLLVILFSFSLVSLAQTTSWKGTNNDNWRTDANWTNGQPDANTHVVIGDANFTGSFQPTLERGRGKGECKSLTVGNGTKASTFTILDGLDIYGTLIIGANGAVDDSGGRLTLEGDWINSGAYNASGSNRRVYFTGAVQTIGGSTATDFERLYINDGSSVTLAQNLNISNFMDLSGTFDPTPAFKVTGTGKIDIKSGGELKVMAAVITTNYATTINIDAGTSTSVINYASTSVNQSISDNLSYRILRISGSTTKSLVANTTVIADLLITGGTLDLGDFTANRSNSGGSIVISAGSALKIGGTRTFPANYSSHSIATTSTVEYYGGNQSVAAEAYGNLIFSSVSGTVTKTMPTNALTIAGNLTTSVSAGTLAFTALNIITVRGDISLGSNSTFNGSTFAHTSSGDWINNGAYSGCGGTFTFTKAGAVLSGSGTNNFGNLVIGGSGTTLNQNTSFSACGNFSTSVGGSFRHVAGGTGSFTMTGASKAISGSSIVFNNLNINAGASISTTSSLTIAGNLVADGTYTATSGTTTFSGAGKSISGTGAIQLAATGITGSLTTARDLSLSSNINVSGSFTATAGQVTLNGTSTLSGVANLFNVRLTSVATLTMGSGSTLGIAGAVTLDAGGIFNPTANTPNTVSYNGAGAQSIVFTTYNNLTFSGTGTKTPPSALTINGNLTIGSSTIFSAGSYTHSLAGNWVNSGTFTMGTSTIQLTGSNDASITGATTFNNLTINKGSSNKVTLANSVSVATLAMTSGGMLTGANTITITTTRTGNGLITGRITRTHAYATSVNYEFEGPNTFINFSSITIVPITSITMVVAASPNLTFPGAASINRTYDISMTGGTVYSATVRFHYEQAEINGNVESAMTIWEDGGTGSWTDENKTGNDVSDNWVEKSGVTVLPYKWTISEGLIKYSWDGSASTLWSDINNWTPAIGIPGIADVVYFGDLAFTNQPTIATLEQVKKVYFNSTTPTTLTLSGGGSLTVQGNIDGFWSADAVHTISVGSRTLTTFSDIVLSNGTTNRRIDLTASTGTINVNGSLTQAGGASITFTDAGSLNISGDFNYVNGAFTPNVSTIFYNGVGTQSVGGVTYYDLNIDKAAGTTTMNSPVTVSNNLTLSNGGQLDVQTTLSVAGNINIGSGTILSIPTTNTINVSGNWVQDGVFQQGGGTIVFNGTGTQTTDPTTFNNLTVNKPTGTLSVLGDLVINGNIDIQAGTVEVSTYDVSRSTLGGSASLGAGAVARFGGSGIQINNFGTLIADPTSTIEFYTASSRIIPPIAYGNLILSNGGSNPKIMVGPTTVRGKLTVNSGSTLTAPGTTLTLEGDYEMNGTFNANGGALILDGTGNIDGDIIYNDMVVNGTYTLTSGSATFTGDLSVTSSGDFDAGAITVISEGDFTNSGAVSSSGTVTFAGNQIQNIRLLNAISSASTGVVNFNGTVSPTLNSTSAPQFATVNINNTAPIVASQPWSVFVAMNIAPGATWDGGPLTHTFYRNFINAGTVISSGRLAFKPSTTGTVTLGTGFTSNREVEFGGAGVLTLSESNPAFTSVIISNTNAAGVTPSTAWSISQDLLIGAGSQLNGGAFSHTLAGRWTNNGTFNGETSTITFNSSDGTDGINGNGINNFHNLVFSSGTVMDIVSDFSVSGDFTNNAATLSLIDQAVVFSGTGLSALGGTTVTAFDDLEVNKTGNKVLLNLGGTVSGTLILTGGALDLNGNALSVTNSSPTAIARSSGYILSESTSFGSVLSWAIGADLSQFTFPFGTSAGDYIPFVFDLNSGNAGTVSIATYTTSTGNLPLPPGVAHVKDNSGVDNSVSTVDRFFLIDLVGELNPNVDVTFNASAAEVGSIGSLRAQRWNGANWDQPLPGQTAGATSVTVPGVTQFSPWAMSGDSSPLPIELISFTADQVGAGVSIKWETASETNNDYFEILKSRNGEEFFTINKVNGAGNSTSRRNYSATDRSQNTGKSYYQLKQVDFDGKSTLSEIVMVNSVSKELAFTLYPNPATEYLNIVPSADFDDLVNVILYDQLGNTVLNKNDQQISALNGLSLDISAAIPGVYILKVFSQSLTKSFRVLIE